jgi:hypothetical protein
MVEIRLQPVFAHDGVTIDRVRIGIYEVLCSECGDDSGPFEHQSLELQKLRGPYLHNRRRDQSSDDPSARTRAVGRHVIRTTSVAAPGSHDSSTMPNTAW